MAEVAIQGKVTANEGYTLDFNDRLSIENNVATFDIPDWVTTPKLDLTPYQAANIYLLYEVPAKVNVTTAIDENGSGDGSGDNSGSNNSNDSTFAPDESEDEVIIDDQDVPLGAAGLAVLLVRKKDEEAR